MKEGERGAGTRATHTEGPRRESETAEGEREQGEKERETVERELVVCGGATSRSTQRRVGGGPCLWPPVTARGSSCNSSPCCNVTREKRCVRRVRLEYVRSPVRPSVRPSVLPPSSSRVHREQRREVLSAAVSLPRSPFLHPVSPSLVPSLSFPYTRVCDRYSATSAT